MKRRNFMKMIAGVVASVPTLATSNSTIEDDYEMKIDLSEVDGDSMMFITAEGNENKPDGWLYSGLVKDYDESLIEYDGNVIVRIRKYGFTPYEYKGCDNIKPVQIVDSFLK